MVLMAYNVLIFSDNKSQPYNKGFIQICYNMDT